MLRKFAPGGLVKLSASKHPPKVYFHFCNFNNVIALSLLHTHPPHTTIPCPLLWGGGTTSQIQETLSERRITTHRTALNNCVMTNKCHYTPSIMPGTLQTLS